MTQDWVRASSSSFLVGARLETSLSWSRSILLLFEQGDGMRYTVGVPPNPPQE